MGLHTLVNVAHVSVGLGELPVDAVGSHDVFLDACLIEHLGEPVGESLTALQHRLSLGGLLLRSEHGFRGDSHLGFCSSLGCTRLRRLGEGRPRQGEAGDERRGRSGMSEPICSHRYPHTPSASISTFHYVSTLTHAEALVAYT